MSPGAAHHLSHAPSFIFNFSTAGGLAVRGHGDNGGAMGADAGASGAQEGEGFAVAADFCAKVVSEVFVFARISAACVYVCVWLCVL